MSPPSLATAGRTRVSIRSLIWATVSASASLKNSSASSASSSFAAAPSASTGAAGGRRRAGHVVLHDRAEDRGLELLPFAVRLGHGDEVRAEEHAGNAGHLEQARSERRSISGIAVGKFHRAAIEHEASRDEFQRRGIGGGFGLNEHGCLRRRRFKAGA